MGPRRIVLVSLVGAAVACGSLLPSSGDDDDERQGERAEARGETTDRDASHDEPTTVPVDPTVDNPPALTDASSSADAAGNADAGGTPEPPASNGVWSCETTTIGPFSSATVCEAGRNTTCDAPRSDVVDGKPCD